MSKPMGMTPFFQIVTPTRAEDKIWDAVDEAIASNWTPDRFIKEVRQAWQSNLDQQKEDINKDFQRLLK